MRNERSDWSERSRTLRGLGRARRFEMNGEMGGEPLHGRRVEQGEDGERLSKATLQAVHEDGTLDGVAPQLEEVVADAEAVGPQHLAPDLGDQGFERSARR